MVEDADPDEMLAIAEVEEASLMPLLAEAEDMAEED